MDKEEAKGNRAQSNNLPIKRYLIYLLLLCFALSGVTLSKYISSTQGADSARVIKIGNLTVEDMGSDEIIIPGVNLSKKLIVKYGESESSTALFLQVTTVGTSSITGDDGNTTTSDFWSFKSVNGENRFYYGTENEPLIYFDLAEGWNYFKTVDNNYVFYLLIGPETQLTDKVTGPDGEVTVEGKNIFKDQRVYVSENLKNSEIEGLSDDLGLSFKAVATQIIGNKDEVATERDLVERAWNSGIE